MAQTVFVNVTVSSDAVNDPIRAIHVIARGTAAANDLTLSFDPTKVKTLSALTGILKNVVIALQGGAELTP